jgi:O-antigen/teichoic acid export membrane protein
LVWILSTAVATVLFPTIAAQPEELHDGAVITARLSRICGVISVGAAASLGAVADPLIRLWFGADFAASVPALLWLLPGVALFSIVNVVGAFFSGRGLPGQNLRVSLAGLVVTIPAALYLIPRYGIVGASIASTLSYAVSTVVMLILFRNKTHLPIREMLIPKADDWRALTAAWSR